MKKLLGGAAALLGLLAVSEAGGTAYFYRRTMKRNKVKMERTMKMSGTDWTQYMPKMEKNKEYMMAQPHKDVYIKSFDALKLHATHFPGPGKKIVICFHGYTSQGMSDYIGLSGYYLKHGFGMLLPDARAHGQSEGEYVGFAAPGKRDHFRLRLYICQRGIYPCTAHHVSPSRISHDPDLGPCEPEKGGIRPGRVQLSQGSTEGEGADPSDPRR